MAPDFLAAANVCVTSWLDGTALTEEDQEWQDLRAFFESISPDDPSDPVTMMPLMPDQVEDLPGGDPIHGKMLYSQACLRCHGEGAEGDIGSPIGGLSTLSIVSKVCTSGPPSGDTFANMAFFGTNRLSDEELADIAAYMNAPETAVESSSWGRVKNWLKSHL